MKLKVKFITKVSGKENSILLQTHENLDDYSDKILLENSNYRNIFGKPFKDSDNKPWKRGIVKVKNGDRSLHLLFYSGNYHGIKQNECGISSALIHILFDTYNFEDKDLVVSKGSKILFYWNHPSHYQRVAFKLGMVGLFISIISLIPLLIEIINKIRI